MPILDLGRQEYSNLYEQIRGEPLINHHFCISENGVNIIHIDTAILCGKDGEDGSLFIDMFALQRALEGIDITKPAIAIAHHTFDCLDAMEQEQLELLLKQYNTVLYLCGHMHLTRCKNIQIRKPKTNLWEYVCGTNMDNPPREEPAEIGFFIGEIDVESKSGYVEGFRWSKRNNNWIPNSEFSFPQKGAYDGRYYFAKSETANNVYYNNDIMKSTRNHYIKYLKYECGEIRLDGLPFDSEIGNRNIALEKLFVPLRFSVRETLKDSPSNLYDSDYDEFLQWEGAIGNIIPDDGNFRLVVFAGPGGGKTTWMKRLASAYGIGNIENVDDHLPKRTLFPIWIKCRQFGDDTSLSMLEIIRKIPERAEFALDTHMEQSFFQMVSEHIQDGTALFLIDGLDEIGNEANRQAFISKLNRFVSMNEKVNIVMTSRIVGYNQITQNLFPDFLRCKIQPFDQDDIKRLCVGWHKIVLGDTNEVIENAQKLSSIIIDNDRIYTLAQTPVLLTTLLLVNRRIGRLPTKRADLYYEAIKVLLDSWGIIARRPIDLKEAIPQLAYLAHHMIFHNKMRPTIGETELVRVLLQAREDLQEYFSTSSETIHQFIERVEDRSALLMKRGFREKNEDDNQLEIEYEFQHLTFQEYLAAYAVAHQYYPEAKRESRVTECFEGIFENDELKEVILLTSVLTNKWGAADIANLLLNRFSDIRAQRHIDRTRKLNHVTNLLMNMIADESPLTPDLREIIYNTCYGETIYPGAIDGIMAVYLSKYSNELHIILLKLDETRNSKLFKALFQLIELRKKPNFSIFTYYLENINSNNKMETLELFSIATWLRGDWQGVIPENIQIIKDNLIDLCLCDDIQLVKLAVESLFSLCDDEDDVYSGRLLHKLLELYDTWPNGIRFVFSFPVTKNTVLHLKGLSLSVDQRKDLGERMNHENHQYSLLSFFWFGILCGAWDIETVIQKAREFSSTEYITEANKEKLCKNIKKYISVLQDANAIAPKDEDFAQRYLDELEKQMQEKHKFDIFDW
jgi:hypothetical protein